MDATNGLRAKLTVGTSRLCLAPKAQRRFEPGASPQAFELPHQQALKARFNRVNQSNWCGDELRFQRWHLATL